MDTTIDIKSWLKELTLEEKAGLCSGADYWHTKSVERLGIPSVMICDGPHGLRKQALSEDMQGIGESIQTICFPTAAALAASFDRDVAYRLGKILGKICRKEKVGLLLGPGINIKRSPLCGRNFEYLSEDPYLAGELGSAYVQGLQGEGIGACVKHYAANNQETRRMSGTSQVDERTLREIYLPAFEKVVKEGNVWGVMCAYNALNGIFCAENRKLLNDILRDEWHFDGFVVTDWGAVKDRVKGIKAGLDLEMPGGKGTQDKKIVQAVKSGELEESILDESISRMLAFAGKACHEKNMELDSGDKAEEGTGAEADLSMERLHEEAVRIAEECAVLLKNEDDILPLQPEKKIVFFGEFAEKPRYQGAGSSHINSWKVDTALEAAEKYHVAYSKEYDENMAREADIAVIFTGLPDAYETEGVDRESLKMPEKFIKLIGDISACQPNTVVVLHGGSPVEMPWLADVKAVLNMYLSGEGCGQAAVNLLFGHANPSGKLAETWPVKLADNPSYLNFPGIDGVAEYREGIYVGYRYYDKKEMEVLFPFGHGLSYTEFVYSGLKISRERIADTEEVEISCIVRNAGNYFGKEVLQLYVRPENTQGRALRELKDFCKVALSPGEETEASFTLGERAFAYYETKINDWYVESGTYHIEIGASSRDIRLEGAVQIEGTKEKPITYNRQSTIGDLLRSRQGREIFQLLLAGSGRGGAGENLEASKERNTRSLGEGSAKMVENTMMQMPLASLVTFGRMEEEQLLGLIDRLNRKDENTREVKG